VFGDGHQADEVGVLQIHARGRVLQVAALDAGEAELRHRLAGRLGDKARHIAAVVDGNANLHGKRFGDWTVQAPDALPGYAGLPIVISSFRAEQAIARSLRERLQAPELVLLYA